MDCEFLVVSSITYALKAKAELEGHGIACKIEKIKHVAELNGCGYGIRVSDGLASAASRYLSVAGIRVVKRQPCGGDA